MNREILFRGKRIDNGKWVKGYLSYAEQEDVYYIGTTELMCPIETETVGQYTGLKDKNGVKIFEGDMVEHSSSCEESPCEVYFSDYFGGWYPFTAPALGGYEYDNVWSEQCTVIGNVHDNPDLL